MSAVAVSLKGYLLETRPQFLLLSVVLAFLGGALAWYEGGAFRWGYALLAGFGILFLHISCNVLNDYYDYKSGIDQRTQRTPFSGGSGIIQGKLLTPRQVLGLGIGAFVAAVPIGIYFLTVYGLSLVPILVIAAVLTVFYTPVILRLPWPEWAPGLGMGMLPVIGAYFVITGAYTWQTVVAAVPSFLLVHNLLLINEFPDIEADKTAGRRTSPITLGRRRAAWLFSAFTVLVYLWVLGAAIAGAMPWFAMLGWLTLPLAVKAVRGALASEDVGRLVGGMAANVMVVLATQLLIGIGYVIARLVG